MSNFSPRKTNLNFQFHSLFNQIPITFLKCKMIKKVEYIMIFFKDLHLSSINSKSSIRERVEPKLSKSSNLNLTVVYMPDPNLSKSLHY